MEKEEAMAGHHEEKNHGMQRLEIANGSLWLTRAEHSGKPGTRTVARSPAADDMAGVVRSDP